MRLFIIVIVRFTANFYIFDVLLIVDIFLILNNNAKVTLLKIEVYMRHKLLCLLVPTALFFSLSTACLADDKEQKMLDKACEDARDIALEPRRKEIYTECLEELGKTKSQCKSDAAAYNGNRINGAPMFYELPACEKAFDYRNKHKSP